METHNSPNLFFLKTHLTVRVAAENSGYNPQYLRRLLRIGKLEGDKIGQVWLINKDAFEAYFEGAIQSKDQRFGPKEQ